MAEITVYSKQDCVQCNSTYKKLDKDGHVYQVVDMEKDPEALAYVRSLGHQRAPVVVIGDEHWSGFNPGKLSKVKEFLAG